MILQCFIYFFLIFGIAEFIGMIVSDIFNISSENSKTLLILSKEDTDISQIKNITQNFKGSIYILSEDNGYKNFADKHLENIHTVTINQFTEEINNLYGNNNRLR